MKRLTVLFLLVLSFTRCWGQRQSDLYAYVDSLIRYDLEADKETARKDGAGDWITLANPGSMLGLADGASTLLIDNEPMLVFDGNTVGKHTLNSFALKDTRSISVLHPGPSTAAVYGSRSVNGVIVIEGANRQVTTKLKRMLNGL